MRSHELSQDEYDAVLDTIIARFNNDLLTVLEDGHYEFDYYEEQYTISDILGDMWFEQPLSTATYESISLCNSVHDYVNAAPQSDSIAWHKGAKSVIDDITYQYVKQELYERIEPYKHNYQLVMTLHHALHTLTTDSSSKSCSPDSLHTAFANWFFKERTQKTNTVASSLDPLDTDSFTPNHITLQSLLDPTNDTLLLALHHWLSDTHTDTYTPMLDRTPLRDADLTDTNLHPRLFPE